MFNCSLGLVKLWPNCTKLSLSVFHKCNRILGETWIYERRDAIYPGCVPQPSKFLDTTFLHPMFKNFVIECTFKVWITSKVSFLHQPLTDVVGPFTRTVVKIIKCHHHSPNIALFILQQNTCFAWGKCMCFSLCGLSILKMCLPSQFKRPTSHWPSLHIHFFLLYYILNKVSTLHLTVSALHKFTDCLCAEF